MASPFGFFSSLFRPSNKGTKPFKAVLDVKRMTMQDAYAQWLHEERSAGDVSHCDETRAHLNEAWGYNGHDKNPYQAAKDFIKDKSPKIDKRNVKPITSLVLSASPEYFLGKDGKEDEAKTAAWVKATTDWVRKEFGDDLVQLSLHRDEKTPHIHARLVPTYTKKTKRGEVRQVSHNNHPAFKGPKSYYRLWDRYAAAVAPLGIERGEHTPPEAKGSQRAAKQWLSDVARKWSGRAQQLAVVEEREKQVGKREQMVERREVALGERETQLDAEAAELDAYRGRLDERGLAIEMAGKVERGTFSAKRVEPPQRVEKRARRSTRLKGKAPAEL